MNKMININEDTVIYVVCPANNKTGGTELLHQLVYQLNSEGKKAVLAYYMEGKSDRNRPTPNEFEKYIQEYCMVNEIKDSADNVLVLPEVCIGKHRKFKNIQKVIWWLSVDNFHMMFGKLNRLKQYGFMSFLKHLWLNDYCRETDLYKMNLHLYQSFFAADFIMKKGIEAKKTAYLSDYINDVYSNNGDAIEKEDIVIYNPKKGLEFTQKLIEKRTDINWIPIQNMTNAQVKELMRRAKVYIDFGNHPGKDRMPREAALSGCCIITNKRGSAGYNEDVPIGEQYKFKNYDEEIDKVLEKIEDCIKNYDENIVDFYDYLNFIRSEKEKFGEDVRKIFC